MIDVCSKFDIICLVLVLVSRLRNLLTTHSDIEGTGPGYTAAEAAH